MRNRVAIYARYSDELCSQTSIEDQLHRLRNYASQQGWRIVEEYVDREISGQSIGGRLAYQRMMADAPRKRFDIVLAEAVDRIARRTADTTDLRDVLHYYGVDLYAANIGLVTPVHAAILGVVAEQFSRDLADKTKRGQEGATRRGRVASGLAFGYKARPDLTPNRIVDPTAGAVVIRIFQDFANGIAPGRIASNLNQEGVPGPSGKAWLGTTIRGDAARQTGILRNRAYIGEIVYGRMTFSTDPRTGKRRSQLASSPMVEAAPSLRIVDQPLWDRVQARLASIARTMARDAETGQALNRAHRKQYVLSGLLRCGCCHGTYAIMGRDRYGCSTRKNTAGCANDVTITRQAIETRVLSSVKRGLLAPEMVQRFVAKVSNDLRAQRKTARSEESSLRKQLAAAERKIERLLDQIEDGDGDARLLGKRLGERERERETLQARLNEIVEESPAAVPMPNFAEAYAAQVRALEDVLRDPSLVQLAHETLAKLIEKVVLTPDPEAQNGLRVDLHGDLARILSTCAAARNEELPAGFLRAGSQLSVVAGVGFEPTTFRL
jgi:site-specific DNA recombinase